MKLTDFKQTVFVTEENLNKICFEFDELEEGAKIEILGKKFSVDGVKFHALIPCVSEETLAPVTLSLPDGSFASYTYTLKPQNECEVCLVNISDFGGHFDDYCTLEKPFADSSLAAEICGEFPDFRYALEAPSKEALEHAAAGGIEILPEISRLCTASACEHSLAEKLKKLKKYSASAKNSKTAYIASASGLSLGAVPYLADAGIKNVIIEENSFRSSPSAFAAELFRLTSLDSEVTVFINKEGDDILPAHEKSAFMGTLSSQMVEYKLQLKGNGVLAEFEERIDTLLGSKNVIPIIKQGEPDIFLKALADEMKSKWKYPRFSLCTPTEFMEKLSLGAEGNIPSVSGEISCPNADDLTAFGELTAKYRQTSMDLPAANAISLIKAAENPANTYFKANFEKCADKLSKFCDDRLPFNVKNPVEMHKFNMFYSKAVPIIEAEKLIDSAFRSFIDRRADGFVTVINTTLRKRNGSILTPVPLNGVACQKVDEGYITEPVSLPPFGTKSFIKGEYKEAAPFANVSGSIIDTGHYRITIDQKSGQIKSIIESTAMRELIDSASEFSLGDLIFVAGSGTSADFNLQKCIDFEIENGSLAVSIIRRGLEEQSRAEVSCKITFYKHSKNIDLKLKFSGAAALAGDFYDRYQKNLFFALPLRCEDYHFKSTNITGEISEGRDRLPLGSGDFALCQRYAAVENDYCGTAVFCREMPVFHFGGIQYGSFSPQPNCTSSGMFLYAASNRANQLVYNSQADACGEFNLSILPYRGNAEETVSASAMNFLHMPRVVDGYSVERSRMAVSEEGILFDSLTLEDDGAFLLRITETLARRRKAIFSLPFNISRAFRADIFGHEREEITEFSENRISVMLQPSSPLTLKLYPARNYSIKTSESRELKAYSYTAHCGRCVAVWDKCGSEPRDKYEIFCDGEKIADVRAQASETQIYMTEKLGKHDIEVK